MSDAPYTFIKSPDGAYFGKWFLPSDCATEQEARGRHISEFRFGGLYEILSVPRKKDFPTPEAFSSAFKRHCDECESQDVEMIMSDMQFVFLRFVPESYSNE